MAVIPVLGWTATDPNTRKVNALRIHTKIRNKGFSCEIDRVTTLRMIISVVVVKRAQSILSIGLALLFSNLAHARNEQRLVPDQRLTPGAVCTTPDEYRYPAQIPYCRRILPNSVKDIVIQKYNQVHLMGIHLGNRRCYKVDHLIPLCLGGANDLTNLWPQHVRAGRFTDPLEPLLCQKLAENKVTQAHAIRIILDAKSHPAQSFQIYRYVETLQVELPVPPARPLPALTPRQEPPYEPNIGSGPADMNDCFR